MYIIYAESEGAFMAFDLMGWQLSFNTIPHDKNKNNKVLVFTVRSRAKTSDDEAIKEKEHREKICQW